MVSRASSIDEGNGSKHMYRETFGTAGNPAAMLEIPERTATADYPLQSHMRCPTCLALHGSRSGWNSESASGATTPWNNLRSDSPIALSEEHFTTEKRSTSNVQEEPYHVFSHKRKLLIVALVSLSATFSPLASNIYFPALGLLADDMKVSHSTINFTVTIYLVAQSLAPSFWGPLADNLGRRQVLIYTLLIFLAANVGLALSQNVSMLLVFRFLQAAGSASTISLGAGVIADLAPPSERGGFIGTFAGVRQFSLAFGPVLGGFLGGTLGWRSIFWFLVIFAGCVIGLTILCLPETLRRISGNGSARLTSWKYRPVVDHLRNSNDNHTYLTDAVAPVEPRPPLSWRNFVSPFRFLFEKDVACTLFFGSVVYCVWSMVVTSTNSLLQRYYHLTTIKVGLCYLPNGIGCVAGSYIAGKKLDSDYRASEDLYRFTHDLPKKHPLPKADLPADFPLEHTRLGQIVILVPMFVFGVVVYGFSLNNATTLALPLIAQFVIGFASTAVLNINNTLTVDLYPGKGAAATAVNNLARCAVGAVGVSLVGIGLDRLNPGILFLILGLACVAAMPLYALQWKFGMKWRGARVQRLRGEKEREEGKMVQA